MKGAPCRNQACSCGYGCEHRGHDQIGWRVHRANADEEISNQLSDGERHQQPNRKSYRYQP